LRPKRLSAQADVMYGALADLVLVVHLGFIVFVVGGGLLTFRWPRLVYVHVPAAAWGAWVELAGWPCPLTPLENRLRTAGGRPPYAAGFIEHYVAGIVYPPAPTPELQWALGGGVVLINVIVYTAAAVRHSRH
jgi:hypothetical protein